ncbi:MAG: metalloregulator ArsR/SmtB family transcription factor [Armatimonas sp.]
MTEANLDYAAMFKALGDPTRLRIFEYLRSCCCGRAAVDETTGDARTVLDIDSPTVGEVCCQVTGSDRITSSLSTHLKELRTAGLIHMERRGKYMLCSVNPQAVTLLALYFSQEPDAPQETRNNGCC